MNYKLNNLTRILFNYSANGKNYNKSKKEQNIY